MGICRYLKEYFLGIESLSEYTTNKDFVDYETFEKERRWMRYYLAIGKGVPGFIDAYGIYNFATGNIKDGIFYSITSNLIRCIMTIYKKDRQIAKRDSLINQLNYESQLKEMIEDMEGEEWKYKF